MKKPVLYERVALTRDLEEHGLERGDVATLIETVPHPCGGGEGVVLEVTNALGESLQVVIGKAEGIEPLTGDDVLAVPSFVRTSYDAESRQPRHEPWMFATRRENCLTSRDFAAPTFGRAICIRG